MEGGWWATRAGEVRFPSVDTTTFGAYRHNGAAIRWILDLDGGVEWTKAVTTCHGAIGMRFTSLLNPFAPMTDSDIGERLGAIMKG